MAFAKSSSAIHDHLYISRLEGICLSGSPTREMEHSGAVDLESSILIPSHNAIGRGIRILSAVAGGDRFGPIPIVVLFRWSRKPKIEDDL
jgi:hypothetical protein